MKRRVCIAITVMGFSGLVAEILFLRELLIVFSGNELSIGIILANWLILEAFGCFFPGRMVDKSKNKLETFTLITILFSISLLIAVFLTRILKSAIGVSVGESIGLVPMFYSSFLILLPVSILHGALFTFSCRIYSMFSTEDASAAGRVYVYETVGTLIGGIVCTYLFIPYLNAFQAALGRRRGGCAGGAVMTDRVIPLTPPGPLWSQREYVECMRLGLGFAAHRYGATKEAFHYAFTDDIPCTTVIVTAGGVERYIDHEFCALARLDR